MARVLASEQAAFRSRICLFVIQKLGYAGYSLLLLVPLIDTVSRSKKFLD